MAKLSAAGVGLAVLIAVFFCAVAPASGQAVKDLPRPTDYISDYAGVMSQPVKYRLDRLCGEVDHEAHAKLIVVIINTTNGEPIQQYAVDLEDAWKVGTKGSDRSVIVLLAVKDRRRFIYPGYGLEGILPDGKVGDIGRQMIPMLRANDFDNAVTLAVDEISQIIAQDAGVKLKPLSQWGAQVQQQPHATPGQIIGGVLFLIFVVIFLLWAGGSGLLGFLLGMFFGGGGGFGGGFGGGGGFGSGGDNDSGSGFDGLGGSGSGGGAGAGGSW